MAKADSIINAETRSAQIRAASEQLEREAAEKAAKMKQHLNLEDNKARVEEAKNVEIVASGETREHLLDRIRSMRNEQPAETPAPPPLTERMLAELNAEQTAGRNAIQRAEEMMAYNRKIADQVALAERERLGEMVPVYHPNPAQNEQYPASGATLGKKK